MHGEDNSITVVDAGERSRGAWMRRFGGLSSRLDDQAGRRDRRQTRADELKRGSASGLMEATGFEGRRGTGMA